MRTIGYIVVGLLAISCEPNYHDSISGNGKVKSEIISLDTISRVRVSNKIDVTIIPSDSVKVVLRADENLFDIIHYEIDRGYIRIFTKKHIRMAKSKEVLIYGSCISRIEASMRAAINVRDSLKCSELDVLAASGAGIRIIGNIDRLSVKTETAGSVHLSGHANYLNADASTASDIFAFDLIAKDCDITATTASNVRITIENEARLDATSAADIRYRGEAEIINSRENSLGDIKKVNF